MIYDPSATVHDFLNAAAAKQPTPGGGAAAALTGALAASMAEMVLNYSVNKKGLEHFQSELQPALEKATKARLLLQQLMVEDQQAYLDMTAARKLPPDTEGRQQKIDETALAAVRVPQSIVVTSLAVLGLCDHVVCFVNPWLLSDLAVAADLAMASARCGIYNVRINLPSISDPAARTHIESSLNDLLLRASKLIQRTTPRIWDRIQLES